MLVFFLHTSNLFFPAGPMATPALWSRAPSADRELLSGADVDSAAGHHFLAHGRVPAAALHLGWVKYNTGMHAMTFVYFHFYTLFVFVIGIFTKFHLLLQCLKKCYPQWLRDFFIKSSYCSEVI